MKIKARYKRKCDICGDYFPVYNGNKIYCNKCIRRGLKDD